MHCITELNNSCGNRNAGNAGEVQQSTNTGVRRPRYEPTVKAHLALIRLCVYAEAAKSAKLLMLVRWCEKHAIGRACPLRKSLEFRTSEIVSANCRRWCSDRPREPSSARDPSP